MVKRHDPARNIRVEYVPPGVLIGRHRHRLAASSKEQITKQTHGLGLPQELRTASMDPGRLDLPAEIALRILQYADCMPDVFALILTAPIFNGIWITYKTDVRSAVLPRSIECYPEAMQLYTTWRQLSGRGDEGAFLRHERLLAAARCATSVRDLFVANYSGKYVVRTPKYKLSCNSDLRRDHEARMMYGYPWENEFTLSMLPDYTLTNRERKSFIRAFYYLWETLIIASFNKTGLPEDYALPNLEDVTPVREMIKWISLNADPRLQALIRKAYSAYTPQDHARYATYERWRRCSQVLRSGPYHNNSSSHSSHSQFRRFLRLLETGSGSPWSWHDYTFESHYTFQIHIRMRQREIAEHVFEGSTSPSFASGQ